MSNYKPYPAYTDSGVEWLGKVPEYWEIKRLRFVAQIQNSNVDKKSYAHQKSVMLCNYTDVYYNERISPDLAFMSATASDAEIEKFTLQSADVIITKDSEEADDIGIPAYVPQAIPGVICGYHLAILKSYGVTGEFLFRILQSQPTKAYFFVEVSGVTRFGLGQDAIGNIPVPLPSSDEQVSICRWIDRETAHIDALTSKKSRFIELLREKRQALITQAVTRGLDPTVKMKDSGVEWLGKVPEHWDIGVLCHIASRTVVGIAEAATHAYANSGVPILRSTNIRPYKIIGEIFHINPKFALDKGTKLINAGDLITVRTGNAGVTAVIPAELDGCQCFTMLITTLQSAYIPNFYCYWMNSATAMHYFALEGWGTAQINISVPILKALPVPMLSNQEQKEIVAYLDRETTRIDSLISKTQHSINLLKERRAALITAAVTGQIDVRCRPE